MFSWKIYEHIFLTPCCTWQLPASSLTSVAFAFRFSAILSKAACLGMVKYLKSDLTSVPSPLLHPPQSIITLAHLCDRNNSFCLPKLQSPVARQLHPEATKQRGNGCVGGPSPSARAAACAAGSYNWGRLGMYCFHQRFGITGPARLRNFQLGGYRLWLVLLVSFRCYSKALGMLLTTEPQMGVACIRDAKPTTAKGKHSHPFQPHAGAQPNHTVLVDPPQGPDSFPSPPSGTATAQLLWHYLCPVLVTVWQSQNHAVRKEHFT